MPHFFKSTLLPVSAAEAYAWHARPGAFERLTPPWEPVHLNASEPLAEGSLARLGLQLGPLPLELPWHARHRHVHPGEQFQDVQERGPFQQWEHTHRFVPLDNRHCRLEDEISFQLPLAPLSTCVLPLVYAKLERMFAYRHAVTRADCAIHQHYARQGVRPMKILVTGASGLIGSALIPFLTTGGHEVLRLVRQRNGSASSVHWSPSQGEIDAKALEGLDAVIHLAGESIADGRWTEAKKNRILKSRTEGTLLLAQTLAKLKKKPKLLISASAIGYYGDCDDQDLTEDSPPGDDFLADVCLQWEKSCQPARDAGIRVINPRIGLVLSGKGGALEKMLMPFQLGLGGVLGRGQQYLSWIAIDDVVAAFLHLLTHPELAGPINLTAPEPLTNAEFTRTLGKVLLRPTILPVPAFSLRALMGEMADALLLSSAKVLPDRLLDSGFEFKYPDIVSALRHVLGGKG